MADSSAPSASTALPPGMHAGKSGHQLGWPRCRWCHQEIQVHPASMSDSPNDWEHVTTANVQCEGRKNLAEPVPQIHEEPFMEAAWEFVTRYRNLRRAFRDISTSRASAVRRMQDYQKLADDLIDALDNRFAAPDSIGMQTWLGKPLYDAILAIRDYRKTSQAAGWR